MRRNGKVKIKDLPLSSRPREKLEAHGRNNLADAELLAILLGSGSVRQNVLALSEKLLRQIPLKKLSTVATKELITFPGIGNSKASRILAALELGERIYAPMPLNKSIIRSTTEALNELKTIAEKRQEYLVVLYLNARHELLQKEIIGIGSLTSMLITPKEIFSPALASHCASIVVAHNHPSGDPMPSDDDIKFTRQIHEAGEVMGIPLIDHLILARTCYFSFKDNKVGNNR